MNESIGLIIPAFIAGIITFLAPCTLPLVPAYLGFISGTSIEKLKNTKKKSVRRKIFLNGLFFMLGVTIIFVSFGMLAGLAGQALSSYRIWIVRVGGVFVIIFGLFMIGILKIPFFNYLLGTERKIKLPFKISPGKPLSSVLLGGAFAAGWTPCIGPIVGTILLLASTSATALQGGFLLFIFSMGLAVPFLIVAAALGTAISFLNKIKKYLRWVEILGGIFLILLGLLLFTNNLNLLVGYGFRFFQFINYDWLLDYL